MVKQSIRSGWVETAYDELVLVYFFCDSAPLPLPSLLNESTLLGVDTSLASAWGWLRATAWDEDTSRHDGPHMALLTRGARRVE